MTPQSKPEVMKQVAILGGGDWFDASVEHLSVPDDLNLADAKREFDEWRKTDDYISFPDWLRKFKGAEDSSVECYRVFEED